MSEITPLEALRDFHPYCALPEPALERLAEHSRMRVLAENEVLARRDEPALQLYMILEGSLLALRQNQDGRDRTAFHFNTGDSMGETLLLKGLPYPYDVTAVQGRTRLIETDGHVFTDLFRAHPELQTSLVEAQTNKIVVLALRVVSLSLASANTRLARYVLTLPRSEVGDVQEVELPLPKKDLAALLAITPEHLSRILRRWADARIVRMAGRGLQLSNLAILEAMADIEEELTSPSASA